MALDSEVKCTSNQLNNNSRSIGSVSTDQSLLPFLNPKM